METLEASELPHQRNKEAGVFICGSVHSLVEGCSLVELGNGSICKFLQPTAQAGQMSSRSQRMLRIKEMEMLKVGNWASITEGVREGDKSRALTATMFK